MPNLVQKVNNSFIKGLITEAGELTFPENASVDELNCELYRDGSRRRRKGIAVEDGAVESSFSVYGGTVISTGDWDNVGDNSSQSYLTVQVGSTLYFYNKGDFPYSDQELASSVDLLPYQVSGSLGISAYECQFASILGALVVVNKAMKPIYIESVGGSLVVTEIDCYIRDLSWLTCKEGYDSPVPVADVTNQRKYDTANCGWAGGTETGSIALGDSALQTYISSRGEYPALTHPWFSGKNSSGNFSVSEWLKIYSGTSLIGNGHFILDLFNRDRSTVSGIPGLGVETEATRFTTITAFSGRVFFSGLTGSTNTGKIYYSQVLQNLCDMGLFYQRNDPTSEEISDLLETDGGFISIPDARDIRRIYSFRNSLFIFADNGVWQVKGVDNVFSPTAYSVSRITEMGINSAGSFTAAEGVPFWWSRHGIHTLAFDEFGNASEQNLSISTIQSFWNAIDANARDTVKATYDKVNKKIIWLYKNNSEPVVNKYNRILVLDVTLQSFYPWKIEDQDGSTNYIVGMSFYSGSGVGDVTFNVVDGIADQVVVGSDNVVVSTVAPLSTSGVSVIFLVRLVPGNTMTMGLLNSDSFYDWGNSNYSSYAVTGYDFVDNLALKKTAPYLSFFMRETETGWTLQDDGSYLPENESSMLVSCFWDFKKTPSSIPQQAYKRQQPIIPDSADLSFFDSPATVVTSKLRVRGRGRSLTLKFESEEGKNFIYLGHGLIADVAARF